MGDPVRINCNRAGCRDLRGGALRRGTVVSSIVRRRRRCAPCHVERVIAGFATSETPLAMARVEGSTPQGDWVGDGAGLFGPVQRTVALCKMLLVERSEFKKPRLWPFGGHDARRPMARGKQKREWELCSPTGA